MRHFIYLLTIFIFSNPNLVYAKDVNSKVERHLQKAYRDKIAADDKLWQDQETVRRGDYMSYQLFEKTMWYDGDYMSWDEGEEPHKVEFYDVYQSFLWTEQELKQSAKAAKFSDIEFKGLMAQLATNAYPKYDKMRDKANQINELDSVMFLTQACLVAGVNIDKCDNFYYDLYAQSVKKWNNARKKPVKTYGPLNLPITTLVQTMFYGTACIIGQICAKTNHGIPVSLLDSKAKCSYDQSTDEYTCILNRQINWYSRCTVKCSGKYYTTEQDVDDFIQNGYTISDISSGNNLAFDGYCSGTMIIPNNREYLKSTALQYKQTVEEYINEELEQMFKKYRKKARKRKVQKAYQDMTDQTIKQHYNL